MAYDENKCIKVLLSVSQTSYLFENKVISWHLLQFVDKKYSVVTIRIILMLFSNFMVSKAHMDWIDKSLE